MKPSCYVFFAGASACAMAVRNQISTGQAYYENQAHWVEAGKKVAFRVYWIGSGYWRHPTARTATPASVWEDGAKFVRHADSGTEIPLIWDPIYKRRALAFLAALAARYDDNTNVLFFDVTPGAETNPYRFVAFNQRTPEFKEQTPHPSAAASAARHPTSTEMACSISFSLPTPTTASAPARPSPRSATRARFTGTAVRMEQSRTTGSVLPSVASRTPNSSAPELNSPPAAGNSTAGSIATTVTRVAAHWMPTSASAKPRASM